MLQFKMIVNRNAQVDFNVSNGITSNVGTGQNHCMRTMHAYQWLYMDSD